MAAKTRVFLDVDSNILENNLLLEECKTDLSEYKALLGLEDGEKSPWTLATPQPGFCCKTKDDKQKKAFVNICTLKEIPEPRDVDEEELLKLIEAADASEFRVPLSLQEPHEELDKGGNTATCYDVAINPKFFQKVESSAVFKLFLLQVTFDGIKDKFNVDLNIEDYIILRNKKNMGILKPHRIRTMSEPYKPPKKMVQEVSTPSKPLNANSKNRVTQPVHHRFAKTSRGGKEFMYGEILLPSITTMRDVKVDVGEDRIIIMQKLNDLLDVFLPVSLDADNAYAEFSHSSKILHLWIPILS